MIMEDPGPVINDPHPGKIVIIKSGSGGDVIASDPRIIVIKE